MNSLVQILIVLTVLSLGESAENEKSLVPRKEDRSLCSASCNLKFPIICGSDGKNHHGLCELMRANCRSKTTIKFVKFGKCPTCQMKGPVFCIVPACFRPTCPAYPKATCVSFCACKSEYYYRGRKVNCYTSPTNPCKYKFCRSNAICKVLSGKAVCVPKDVCSLPPIQGPCEAHIERYFHNVTSSKCEKFYYGGCRGNKNNFETIKECEMNCKRSGNPCALVFCGVGGRCKVVNGKPICISSGDICSLPKEVGLCKALIPRYYYNTKTRKCEKFYYGGCGGNKNNFKTLSQCNGKCPPKGDICSLPKVVGLCKALIQRYYYNTKTKKCEKFYYGGCGGNKNNFKTLSQCNGKCPPKGNPCLTVKCNAGTTCGVENGQAFCRPDFCLLPSVTGPCRARMPRYFYNKRTGKCEKFIYGGCRGNKNNFRTLKECENQCRRRENPCLTVKCNPGTTCGVENGKAFCRQDFCLLPSVTGPCRARMPRYFYNKRTGKCEKFTYGGCRGNKNNFRTLKECENQCRRRDTCPVGKPLVNCLVAPCHNARCPANPSARCVNNYCGGCKADFYVGGRKVNCKVLANPCIATLCFVGTRCIVVNGKARCVPNVPIKPTVHPLCAAVSCLRGTKCIVRNGRPLCVTPCSSNLQCKQQGSFCNLIYGTCQCRIFCFPLYRPVCGSDGRRYANKCFRDSAACRQRKTITTVPCKGK